MRHKSRLWRGICKTWDRMKEEICWALGGEEKGEVLVGLMA